MFRRFLLAPIFIFASATAFAASEPDHGSGHAKDGDDIIISGQDFRLADIDAIEFGQKCTNGVPCGAKAREALAEIIGTQKVSCRPRYVRGGRIIANCFVGDLNIGTEMVRRGWAVVRPDFAKERSAELCAIEAEAAAAKRGAWAHGFVAPFFVKHRGEAPTKPVSCAMTVKR